MKSVTLNFPLEVPGHGEGKVPFVPSYIVTLLVYILVANLSITSYVVLFILHIRWGAEQRTGENIC